MLISKGKVSNCNLIRAVQFEWQGNISLSVHREGTAKFENK